MALVPVLVLKTILETHTKGVAQNVFSTLTVLQTKPAFEISASTHVLELVDKTLFVT